MKSFHQSHRMHLFFIINLMIICTSVTLAQTTPKKLFAVVDIVMEDTAMLHPGAIHFNMSKNGINSKVAADVSSFDHQIIAAKTRMIIPLAGALAYGRIDYVKQQQAVQRPFNPTNDLFIFQAGDTVVLHLSDHDQGAFFTGKSADRYNCMYRISNSDEINAADQYNAFMELKDYDAAYRYRKSQRDSLYALQRHILESYKARLSPEVYQLIRLDGRANYSQHLVSICYMPFLMNRAEEYPTAKRLFDSCFAAYKDPPFADTALLVRSYKYGDFLVEKEKAFAVIQKSQNGTSYYSNLKFEDINEAIDQHYASGILKDKVRLLAFYAIDRHRQGDFVNFIDKAIDEAKAGPFKTALIQFRAANSIGADAFPFALPDQRGKIHRLSDFSGKVVVLDFWFTGCHGCVDMAASLKPIISFYKPNSHVVFISVSIDRNKDLWLKSVEKETYSSKDEINLLAGMDRESTIYQHYNLQGCPTLIVISKTGRILSVTPPDPRIDAAGFKAFINTNL